MAHYDASTPLGKLLRSYFLQYLKLDRGVSDNTIASYACTFRLLLSFCEAHRKRSARSLDVSDLDAATVLAFLNHLEQQRRCGVATRNARLSAIRSFFKYVGVNEVQALPIAQQVLAIPEKRFDRKLVGYLAVDEMKAVLSAIDVSTWSGRRDHALLVTAYATGARVSELVGMLRADANLASSLGTVRFHGKGRKERAAVLTHEATKILRRWERELGPKPLVLFPNRSGERMTRSGVRGRLLRAVERAAVHCPSLRGRKISPHKIRHTTAMHLLHSGKSLWDIALFLGHERLQTTHGYTQADLEMKRKTLASLPPLVSCAQRSPRPTEADLAFLEKLQRQHST
jgi:integrase/recombinase XerD